jgi:L-ribulokinase
MNSKYTIGLDYGTQSGRAVLVEVETGCIIQTAIKEYTHGVMESSLSDGTKLGTDWALQHPMDYLEVLFDTVPTILKESGVRKEDVIGIAVDFTACTILPLDKQGIPLCMHEEFSSVPHAYVKLWKHHAAQPQANRITQLAESLEEKFLARYGGKISSEWLLPKVMQILEEAPDIYERTATFMEASDWVTMQLTQVDVRNACAAGYKGLWNKQDGYPSKEFLKKLDPRLENLVEEKLSSNVYPQGAKAGNLVKEMANQLGLCEGIAIGVAMIDAHVAVPAVGITGPKQMLMIMGTSTCDIMCSQEERTVPGMCGIVEDGVLPGFFGYEAGQACVGDHFEWYVNNCVPHAYYQEAEEQNINIHQLLTQKAERLRIGENGIIALDWWNGNRSCLVDADLTGLMIGMTLATKPEDMYRALIEATAFGKRIILDQFEQSGVEVNELFACGGISKKNKMLMQIYADVTNREIFIGASDQCPALGAAMFGAVAAGKKAGGYDSIFDAAKIMGKVEEVSYKPIQRNVEEYDKLYQEFKILHDYFGRGFNDVMKKLKTIKKVK